MKRNKHLILIFTVAFMMFTSVWAGAFGAVQSNEDPENANAEPTFMSAGDEEEGVTEDATVGDLETKAAASNYTFAAPTAALEESTVTISWVAPVAKEGAPAVPETVDYTVAATKDGEPITTLSFTVDGLSATATLADAGKYKFTVDAKFTPTGETEEVTVTSEESNEVEYTGTEVPANVTGAKVTSIYKGMEVSWTKDPNATGYRIFRYKSESDCKAGVNSDKDIDTEGNGASYTKESGNRVIWTNTIGVNDGQTYWFAVYAYKDNKDNMSASPAVVSGQGTFVKRMVITGTFKMSKTLKSHDKYHKSKTFKKGYKMTAQGFSSGEYLFQVKDGSKTYTFWVNRTRIKSPKAIYSKKVSYDAVAEAFVNTEKVGSKKNWLIWVSFYTQHVYVFKKSGSKWTLKKHWECSTGKASTPSPMALNGLKALNNFRPKTRHALKWWNGYSGKNALHGKKGSWKMGKPKSHGCIRNPNGGAKYIYKNCPKGTRVYTW